MCAIFSQMASSADTAKVGTSSKRLSGCGFRLRYIRSFSGQMVEKMPAVNFYLFFFPPVFKIKIISLKCYMLNIWILSEFNHFFFSSGNVNCRFNLHYSFKVWGRYN